MSNSGCTTCGGCCTTVCVQQVSPRCECCDPLGSLTLAPSLSIAAGQALAENANGQAVPFNPNAQDGNLTESANFIGISAFHWVTDENGKLTNRGTVHPLAGNPCPKNRVPFWQCGIFRVALLQGYGNLKGLDIARAIVAKGRGHFLPNGENENGEFKLY